MSETSRIQTNLGLTDLQLPPSQSITTPPTLPTQIRVARSTPDDANCVLGIAIPVFQTTFARNAAPDDIHHYVSTHFTLDHILAELNNPNKRFLLAIQGTECVGFSQLTIGSTETCVESLPRKIELQRIYVAEHHHHGGVARILMEATLQLAKAEGYQNVWLGVQGQEEFYDRCGFQTVGNVGQNGYIMARSL